VLWESVSGVAAALATILLTGPCVAARLARVTVAAAILQLFHRAGNQFVAPDQLRHIAGHALATELAELRRLGYQIESHPHHGYRLASAPDRLTADDIKARLGNTVIGSEILVFEQTSSTNDVASYLAHSGAREGVTVFAEAQTKGRGRHGRAWVSPHGKGLWFSVVLRPQLPADSVSRITVAASVAVARAIRAATRLEARIKWPNDVTIAERKVAGILTELHDNAAILGIGLDVNCERDDFPADVPATSLRIATGHWQDRSALAAAVLKELDTAYRQALNDFDDIVAAWAKWSTTLGRQLVLRMGHRRIEGHAQALDGDGALLLRRDNGQVERILGADVILERS